jgi:hypothetical protein
MDGLRAGLQFNIVAESNSFEFLRGMVRREHAISFQIEIGIPTADGEAHGWVARSVDDRDMPRADLVLGQLRGRALPVAAAVFAQRLAAKLESMRAPAP